MARSRGLGDVYKRQVLKMRNPADDGWLTITDTGGAILASIADAAVTTVKVADANITAAKLTGAQSGSAPIYGARAWVNFNGTGTVAIRASGNVSSITDNGTGDYTVNFTTAMPDANYSVVATVNNQNSNGICAAVSSTSIGGTLNTMSTTAVRVISNNTSAVYDPTLFCVAILR
jgi:hypothetical protein